MLSESWEIVSGGMFSDAEKNFYRDAVEMICNEIGEDLRFGDRALAHQAVCVFLFTTRQWRLAFAEKGPVDDERAKTLARLTNLFLEILKQAGLSRAIRMRLAIDSKESPLVRLLSQLNKIPDQEAIDADFTIAPNNEVEERGEVTPEMLKAIKEPIEVDKERDEGAQTLVIPEESRTMLERPI